MERAFAQHARTEAGGGSLLGRVRPEAPGWQNFVDQCIGGAQTRIPCNPLFRIRAFTRSREPPQGAVSAAPGRGRGGAGEGPVAARLRAPGRPDRRARAHCHPGIGDDRCPPGGSRRSAGGTFCRRSGAPAFRHAAGRRWIRTTGPFPDRLDSRRVDRRKAAPFRGGPRRLPATPDSAVRRTPELCFVSVLDRKPARIGQLSARRYGKGGFPLTSHAR